MNWVSKTEFVEFDDDARIAYIKERAKASNENAPEVVFLGGYASDMTGSKATAFAQWAQARGLGFLRFDYRGHGASDGDFVNFGIKDWIDDAMCVIHRLTKGPVILIGSSMGGWIATKIARDQPQKVAALLTIAAAPDFSEDFFWNDFSDEEKATINSGEVVERPSGYDEPYRISPKLIRQGRESLILRSPLKLEMPVRLFQGLDDKSVSTQTAMNLLNHIDGEDVMLTLVKGADHSFSTDENLRLIIETLEKIT